MKNKEQAAESQEVITAYKAFDKNMQCRGFQFEVGKEYIHKGSVDACKSGFHSCENPLDVLNYYPLVDDSGNIVRIATVKASGEISRHGDDSKIASAKLFVEAELTLPKFVSAAIEWIKSACATESESASGDRSNLAASGDGSKLAASGPYSKLAASGPYSNLAASGDRSNLAASGPYSKLAASGDGSKLAASGGSSIAVCSGHNCSAKVGENGCIVLSRWVESEKRYRVSVGYEGENIKAGVFYSLNADGDFVEASE